MIALFVSYIDLSIDFWSMEKFLPPSASLLSANNRGFVSFQEETTRQTTVNRLLFPYPSFGSFYTLGSSSVGCPSLSVNLESTCFLCLGSSISVV